MQNTSLLYKRIIATENHWFECAVRIGGASGTVFGEDKIFSVETSTHMFDDGPEVGHCISQEVTVSLLNPEAEIPRMAMIELFVRASGMLPTGAYEIIDDVIVFNSGASIVSDILTFTEESGARIVGDILYMPSDTAEETSEWIRQGIFYTDTREATHNDDGLDILTLHGYDAMLKANQPYGNSSLQWPSDVFSILPEILGKLNISLDERTLWDIILPTPLAYFFNYPSGYTILETLESIAAVYGGNWIITEQGKLRLITLAGSPIEGSLLMDNLGNELVFGDTKIKV